MIVPLANQLNHLRFGICIERRRFGDVVNEGNFGPEKNAILISELVSVVGMLIVCKAHSCRAYFFDNGHIRDSLGIANGPTAVEPILMHVNAVQIEIMAVQKETV